MKMLWAFWCWLVFRRHAIDEVTKNCTACGASHEAMLDNVVPAFCVPDGKPHPYRPFQWDQI